MRRAGSLLAAVATCVALFTQGSMAQTKEHPERKILSKVAPAYPDLARRMHIGGVVKVEVVVGANGAVKSTKVLGGNPVLIESANDAVRKYKFQAASADTTEVLQLTFETH